MGINLLPIILIIIIVLVLAYQMTKSNNQKAAFVIKRNVHFKLVAFFIVFLIMTTVVTEIFYSKINSATPPDKIENHYDEEYNSSIPLEETENYHEEYNSIEYQIMNHEDIDSDLLLEKRTHPAGQTLTIQWEHDFYEGNSPFIYIERKQTGDQRIEEFLYKPLLIVDDYDFSNAVDVTKPIWTDNKMTIPEKAINDTTVATFFYDAGLIQQLMKSRQLQSTGYSSEYRAPIIHLKIPAELEIVDSDEDYLYFVD
ncbi:hypothetical protein [Sporosarcina jiandibaonis]|uniref:hypothetical protein n=1 Tax=Sporosarcina jiandibaonis TaxID=2715535 RepID=UPI00155358A8|nr:hypothetical protein [Sporosarcina jiandibaonis]